jgi:CPA2 family monovalent cation:H+ antiporter-2
VQESLPVLEIGLVLLAAALAGALARRFGLPAVLGYLVVGLLVGPFTPGYVADRRQIQVLADVGVVLLLFEVGIELDLRALRREPLGILAAVPLQVLLITVVGAAVLGPLGVEPLGALTIGLAVALSSSVVVVNITRSRRRTLDATTGRALVVWAVLQDVVTIFAVAALTVALTPGDASIVPLTIVRLAAFAAVAVALHAVVVPWLLRALRDQPDIFIIVAVSVALATAGLGSVAFGVPLALASFVAGLVLSLSPEAAEARREILPFRDLFAVLFFVAVGSLVDPTTLLEAWPLLVAVVALVGLKVLVVWALAAMFAVPSRRPQLAVGLGQIGEFSFVVLGLGLAGGVIGTRELSTVLLAAALTIAASSIGARLFPRSAATA